MKKRNIIMMALIMVVTVVTILTGCTKTESSADAKKFKEEYEKLNNTQNAAGLDRRNVTINEENPFVYATADEIVARIANKETFYVYFGDTQCPWCRSVVEKFIEVANKKGIDTVYYVRIWDDDHNEILRDKYSIEDKTGEVTVINEGTKAYKALLAYLGDVLSDYSLNYTNKKGKSEIKFLDEKRIFAPNFIYVKDGEAKKIAANSSLQTESGQELTEEILADQEKIFTEFFEN